MSDLAQGNQINILLAKNSGDISSFLSGDLRLIILDGSGVSSFTLIGSSLSGLTGNNHGSNISVGLGLRGLTSGDHGSDISVSFRLGVFRSGHNSGGISSFLGGYLLLVRFYSSSIGGFTLVGSGLGSLASCDNSSNIGICLGLCGLTSSNYGKAFGIGFCLSLLCGGLHGSGVCRFFGGYLCLIGFDGSNVITVGIGKSRYSKNRDHAYGKQEREQFFHN